MIVRMILGYLFWAFLGSFGVHRFFLGRPKSGLTLLLLTVISFALLLAAMGPMITEIMQAEDAAAVDADLLADQVLVSPYFMPSMALGAIVGLWLLADLILVALIVLKDEEEAELARQEAGSTVVYGANMDPSFQATQRAMELDDFDDRPRRRALPDDFVMPWRQENPRGEQKTYKPGED
ncbi:MAG: TM2 domain-containing protein [Pseudomonadota bacterium]